MTDRTRDTLRIATEIQRAESLEQMLSIVLRHVGAWVRYDRAAIALSDTAGNYLEWVEIDDHGRSRADSGRMVPIRPNHPLGGVMLEGKPYLRTDLDGRGPVPMDAMEESASRLIVPLVGEFSTLGVLDVHASKENAFTGQDAQTLAHYARLIAAALETQRDLERSRQLSLIDELTGTYNRRHFIDTVEGAIDDLLRSRQPFSILLFDLDDFRSFNENFGRTAGDRTLKQTAELVAGHLRSPDRLSRLADDSFAVFLRQTDREEAYKASRRLERLLREELRSDASPRGGERRWTASFGLVTAPHDARTVPGLVACAEQALYRAKVSGRGCVIAFHDIPEVQALHHAMSEGVQSPPREGRACEVTACCELMAGRMNLPAGQRQNLKLAARWHDLGRRSLPAELFLRPGPINDRERRLLRRHPIVGEAMLQRAVRIGEVLINVRHQKEFWDGSGESGQLSGEEIPLPARILHIAVVFEALRTKQPYRSAYEIEEAYGVLKRERGRKFDPELVDLFIDAHRGPMEKEGPLQYG